MGTCGWELEAQRHAQVETPLELAAGLSLSLNNRLFLKREDLQPVRGQACPLCNIVA